MTTTTQPKGPVNRDAHPTMTQSEAVLEAEACLQCGGPCSAAPCTRACPAGIEIPRFIDEIAKGRPLDAAATIFSDNVLGGTCSRVCPVQVLCEGSCVLLKEGRRPIQISRLQRYATDQAFKEPDHALPFKPRAKRPESVGVIGAGPAGLACAAELAVLGYAVTVYERRDFPGGLITRGIAPYKQQFEPLPDELEQIRKLGVEFRFGVEIGKTITIDELRKAHKAVFLGMGMGDDMPAKIPGEDLPGVWESLRFIEQLKLSGDTPRIGTRVAVIGGGNTAIDVAREARMLWEIETAAANTAVDVAREARMLGAAEVKMLYRRSEADMPAFPHEIAAAKREGVTIVTQVAPIAFIGDTQVRAVRCVKMRLGPPDASGRPRPEPEPGSEFDIPVDTVIKAIGQKPHAEFFKSIGVEMKGSTVKVDEDGRTSVPGFYAGGDCINGGATVVQAVRDGRRSARAIDRSITGHAQAAQKPAPDTRVETLDGTIRHFQADFKLSTAPKLCKGCNVCVTSCPTSTLSLDSVNRIVVNDVTTCVFCGICEARCPDFAIWISRGSTPRARTVDPTTEVSR